MQLHKFRTLQIRGTRSSGVNGPTFIFTDIVVNRGRQLFTAAGFPGFGIQPAQFHC